MQGIHFLSFSFFIFNMSIDTSKLSELFRYKESDTKLTGKIINVVNQIPYNCFMQNQEQEAEDLMQRLNLNNTQASSELLDTTPISHLERRRRSTVVALGQTNIWQLSTRRGHSAMYAALDSLKKDYRTLYIGGTGTILSHHNKNHVIDPASISDSDKESLRHLLRTKHDMAPVFIDDKLSSGHYEGYSKQGLSQLHSGFCCI